MPPMEVLVLDAALGLLLGGALARWVLWPTELALERRTVRRTQARLAALRHDIDTYKENQ